MNNGNKDYIDTTAYRFEAVVDWFAFRIETVKPTQFRHIRARLAERIGPKLHVEPIDSDTGKRKFDEGGTTTVFSFKVYDAIGNNHQKLVDLFDHLAAKFPLVNVPQVTGLEIALDAYSQRHSDDDLREATRWLMEHLSTPNENVRQYDPSLRTEKKNILFNQESTQLALNPELNLRTGNRGTDLSYQVYWKRTDKGGQVVLEHNQWRARAEFTLLGDKLAAEGIKILDDLAMFDLGSLAKYLRFANLMNLEQAINGKNPFVASGISSVWDDRAVCLALGWKRCDRGTDGYRRHAQSRTLNYSRHTEPNKILNRIVTDKFAKLAARYLTKKNNEN